MRCILRFLLLCFIAGTLPLCAQQVTLLGLRALNHAGAFHGLRHDSAGNLYTLFDAQDGVRLLKLNPAGTQVLGQVQLGQNGDTGIALDLDPAGNIYVAGTTNSLGNVTGTQGTAFPNRAGTRTNSFVASFSPQLKEQWLTFCGAEPLAVTSIAAAADSVFVTGSIFAATLPVTPDGIQQNPAPNSNSNGFVESFTATSGTLRYATYLTGANGDTAPAAIAADASDNTYIVGTTTATGYPTTAALVPVFRSTGGTAVGFLTKLTPQGDGFLFSTFVPGNGLTSVALDSSDSGSLLVSGDVAPGLFPLTQVQVPVSAQLRYQTAVRLALDGSAVQASTLLAPATESIITPGANGSAWIAVSSQNGAVVPLLPVTPVESAGNAFTLRVNSTGRVDRAARFGGLPVANSGFASLPATEGGITVESDRTIVFVGAVVPTLSSDLLATQTYDLPFASAPVGALSSTVRDALPATDCGSSACSGSAGLLATLAPEATAPTLALSVDDLPNLTLRNLGTDTANNLSITASGFTVISECGTSLAAAGECPLLLEGSGPGSITVLASNAATYTTTLPAASRAAKAVTALPRELDFGIVTATSAPVSRTLIVTNLGTTTQTFPSQNATAIASSYTLSETASTCTPSGSGKLKVLGPGGTCTVTLALQAVSSATSDGAVNAHWQIGSADILITGYAQAASLSLSASTIDFGRQFSGGLRSNRYLYLSNSSDRAVQHGSVNSQSAAFTVTDQCPSTLQPHSVCRVALAYEAATSPSSDAATLNVDGMQATVLGETLPQPSITGTASNPNLRVSPTSISFINAVNVTQASSESHTVIVSNAGALPFSLALAVEGDFALSTGCPATLNGDTSCTAMVTFTPTAGGVRQGLLSVTAGSSAPAYVTLSGIGSAILSPDGGNLSFGNVPLNTPSVQWVKVSQSFSSLTVTSSDSNFLIVLVEDNGYGHGQPPTTSFSGTATGSCQNCYLGIQFSPRTTGTQAGTVSLASLGSGKTTSLKVAGNGIPLTGLILTPLTQDLGTVPVHSSSVTTLFQLTNGTADPISTSGVIVTGDFAVTAETTGAATCTSGSLASGATCLIPVRFTPKAIGSRSGTLTASTSAGQVSSSVGGTGSEDTGIAFTPGELRFDNVPGSASQQQTITVTNTSTATASVGAPTVSDPHFTAGTSCSSLAPAATCTVTVNYVAGTSLASGSLLIPITSAPAGAPSTVQYAVGLSGMYTTDTAGLQIVPGEHSTVNFGASATGAPALQRVLHINNLSGKSLAVAVEMPRQFALTGSTCTILSIGGGCDLTIQYTPLASGDTTGTVFVTGTPTDGSATQSGLGYLQGYGTGSSATLTITGDISPTGVLDFGQVSSGQTSSRIITLTNPVSSAFGTALTVRRIRSEAPYLSTSTCGAPLLPGQSCAVTITYAPVFQAATGSGQTSTEMDAGTLVIESDSSDAPQIVDLAGSAMPTFVTTPDNSVPIAAFTTSHGSLNFTSTAVGTASDAQTVTLTNTGTATIHVQGLVPSSGFTASSDCTTLVADATCSIAVRYLPQNTATTLGSLEIQSDSSASLEFVSLLGTFATSQTKPAQSVALSPQSLDFGRVIVRSTASLPATLTNTGTAAVVLGQSTVSGDSSFRLASSSNTNPCPPAGSSLAAGASCTVAVSFTPGSTGTLRGMLSVASSATAQPLTVALSGVGTQPQLSVAPTSISFGDVAVGSTATQAVTLLNSSSLPADGLRFTASKGFAVSSTCGITTVNAGSSCAVNVTFAPTTAGVTNGVLTIYSTDPASPISVPLNGNGLQAGAVTATTLSATPSALDFGNVAVGSSGRLALTLSNPAAAAANSLLFTASAGFIVTSSCGTTLNAYSTCPVLVTFSPTTTGQMTGTVTVQNAAANTPLTIALTGIGTSIQPQLVAIPGALIFGNVAVGSSSTLSATISNTSNNVVNAIAISASSGFTIASTCGPNLNPNSTCSLLVTYTPTTAGTTTGLVTLRSSDAASPLTLALSGSGTLLPPQLSLTPASHNFGTVNIGSSATLTTVLLNTSTMTVSRIAIAATAGFGVSSSCGTTLMPRSSCPIAVTYTATSAGVLSGLLIVNSSDPASPVTASLVAAANLPTGGGGSGGSFLLTVNGGSTTSASVQQGLPASFALAVTPTGGYSGTVALTCSADTAVAYAACSLVPPSVTLAGLTATSTVSIATVSAESLDATARPFSPTRALWCLTPALFLLLVRRKRPAALLVLLAGIAMLGGCGSGGDPRIRYVAPGTYSFHVTATSTSGTPVSQTVAINLKVRPK